MLTMLLVSCAIVFGAWYLINNEYAFTKLYNEESHIKRDSLNYSTGNL